MTENKKKEERMNIGLKEKKIIDWERRKVRIRKNEKMNKKK